MAGRRKIKKSGSKKPKKKGKRTRIVTGTRSAKRVKNPGSIILAEHTQSIVSHIEAGTAEDMEMAQRHQSSSLGIKVDLGDFENITFFTSLGCDFGQDVNPLFATSILTALCAEQIDAMMNEVGLKETLSQFVLRANRRKK